MSIFFMNILWSYRLINDDCHQPLLEVQLHSDGKRSINPIRGTKNKTSPSPYIEHCPDSTIHPITDGEYPLPLFTSSNSPIFLRLPTQLLKSYIGIEPGTLLEEKKTITRLQVNKNNPGWTIVSDNDESCFQKIEQIDLFQFPHVKNWFFSTATKQNQKSNLCTLAQLFLDGGVYVEENKSVTSVFRDMIEGVDALFYVAIDPGNPGSVMSHSVLGAPRGHPMIRRALEIVYNVLFKGMELKFPSDSFIVGALTNAMKVIYNETNINQQNMICHGVSYGVEMNGPNKDINETVQWKFQSDPAPEEKTWLLANNSQPNITNKIPQHISMIYFQKDGLSMDEKSKPAIKLAHDSWTIMNPGYDIRFFNLVMARKYLNTHFHPVFLRAFDCIQAFAGKSDFFRLVVLYRDGGWYSDWKQKCLKENLLADISRNNNFVSTNNCLFVKTHFFQIGLLIFVCLKIIYSHQYIIRDNGNEYSRSNECYSNAFIGATPQHPVIAKYIQFILKNIQRNYYGAH
ncbi:hypothetical protein ACHAXS_007109, partial [Conticribra weissflogii]